jgi:hypothetical protein
MVIWYIFPVLVSCSKKNLATLLSTQSHDRETQSQRCKNLQRNRKHSAFWNKISLPNSEVVGLAPG